MRRIILTLILMAALGCTASLHGQQLDPTEYVYPVRGVSGACSANFGEMRPGHFHAGVDIKTDGVEGKELVAVADGYVSRVVVTAGGYGRALYLTLRNGKTAVYGHLQRFRDDIEARVRTARYEGRTNGVDLSFDASQWPVRQGELIGYSGNSGSSMGPHLHFELRDNRTQRRYNLVHEGIIRPADHTAPRILRLHYIEVDTVRGVPVRSPGESYAVVRTTAGSYRLTRSEALPVGRNGYFVVEASDRRDGVHNTFGIWRAALAVDGQTRFEYRMDGFTYEQARCCDAVSCYPLQLFSRNECIRLARLQGAPGEFYPTLVDRGVLRVDAGAQHTVRIEVEDDSGNRSHLEFTIRGRAESFRAAADTTAVVARRDRATLLTIPGEVMALIPGGALYEPLFCRPERLDAADMHLPAGVVPLSPLYRILDNRTPLYRAMTVTIIAPLPPARQLQAVAAVRTAKGALIYAGGRYATDRITCSTRTAGDLLIVADTLPPSVRPLFGNGADLSRSATLRFTVKDNFAGIAAWRLCIDGEWVPCDRFPMRGTLVHTFDMPPAGRQHDAELSVTDACGNTTRWRGTFRR